MSNIVALWQSSSHKEAMDLLQTIWPALDEASRSKLSTAIVTGPPDHLLAQIVLDERASSRDRLIYERIIVLERVADPPLTEALVNELSRIRAAYPEWRAMPGERAHFNVSMNRRVGPYTRFAVADLTSLEDAALLDLLNGETEQREGLLDSWRQLVVADSERALKLLETLVGRPEQGRADVWCRALWGLREKSKSEPTGRLLALLNRVSDDLFLESDFSQAVAEIVLAVCSAANEAELASVFWELFERSLRAASEDSSKIEIHQPKDWVTYAINCSMGHLAQAFFTALFARQLRVGARIPTDLVKWLNKLVSPGLIAHRPARVIAASRLSYLYAVDPVWAEDTLLPGFRWVDEEEALALWQGFAWQPRIDPQLWAVIKIPFLELFTSERLDRLGDFRRSFAHLLALAGVEFGVEALPHAQVRNAIRAMPQDMRQDVIAWISDYLKQQRGCWPDDTVNHVAVETNHVAVETNVDILWRTRVAPWLKRVWPAEPKFRSGEISEQFALAAIATNTVFPEAVAFITPYLVSIQSFTVLEKLAASGHPDKYPEEAMALIKKLIYPGVPLWELGDLHYILGRIAVSCPAMAEDAAFQHYREQVRLSLP